MNQLQNSRIYQKKSSPFLISTIYVIIIIKNNIKNQNKLKSFEHFGFN